MVLVGHSYGGLHRPRGAHARTGASRGTPAGRSDRSRAATSTTHLPRERQDRWLAVLLPVGARLGISRLVARFLARQLPADDAPVGVIEESGTVAACRVARTQRELAHFDADMERLRVRPARSIGVPLTIVSGARRSRSEPAARRRDCPAGAPVAAPTTLRPAATSAPSGPATWSMINHSATPGDRRGPPLGRSGLIGPMTRDDAGGTLRDAASWGASRTQGGRSWL